MIICFLLLYPMFYDLKFRVLFILQFLMKILLDILCQVFIVSDFAMLYFVFLSLRTVVVTLV